MPINTGLALVGVSLQKDAKTPADEPQICHGLTGGQPFSFERTVETIAVACGYRGNISAHVSEINMNPAVSSLGYQEVLPLYAYAALGKIETTAGPKKGLFRHVITIGESLPSLTIFGQEGGQDGKGFGKTVSCKVNELELTFSDTEPLTMSPNLMGCNLIRLAENPCLGIPPVCYSGFFTPVGGEFRIDTKGRRPVKTVIQSGTWTVTNDCDPVRDPTTRRPAYIDEKLSKAAVSFDVVPETFQEFWEMVTGSENGTEPASHIVYGSYYAKFAHSENPDFTLEIEGSRVPFACEVPEVEPEGGTGVFTFSSEDSYVEKVGDSGITITVVNDIEDYFDPTTYKLPTSLPDTVAYGEVMEGVDAEEMGEFHLSGRSKVISGTAKRVTGHGNLADGYYLPLALDDWEGATVTTQNRAAGPISFQDEVAIVPLGVEGIDVKAVTVTDGMGEATTYELDVECAEDLPTVTVEAKGDYVSFGKDTSELGVFEVSNRSRLIKGTAYETDFAEGFKQDESKQHGYYVCLDVNPWEGSSIRIRRDGEWTDFAPFKENGIVDLWLGKDSIVADAITVKDPEGNEYEYALDIQMGVKPVRMNLRKKVAAKAVKPAETADESKSDQKDEKAA